MTSEGSIGMSDSSLMMAAVKELKDLVTELTREVRQLQADRYPRYVGVAEACQILGIGRRTMMTRLKAGYYPFAFQENGHWRFAYNELMRQPRI